MKANLKATLSGIINIVVNSGIIAIVPPEYKVWALLGFNLVQVVYMFYDPTYAFQKLGKKLGKSFTVEDLK